MVKARFAPVKDAPVRCLGSQGNRAVAFRPADLLVAGDDFHQDCIDVSVVSPLISGPQGIIVVGKKAKEAERLKFSKHLLACEQAGFGFKAFVVDVFGVLTEASQVLLDRVCYSLCRLFSYPVYLGKAICSRKISFSVQLGVARQVLACRDVVLEF
jgi:hypothetical protein